MSRTVNRVPALLRDLQTGYGAQRLPSALRAIKILGVPAGGTRVAHRQLLKRVLPRIKYNNPNLTIDVQRSLLGKRPLKGAQGQQQLDKDDSADAAGGADAFPEPVARLMFDNLPTQDIKLDHNLTAVDITRSILQRIAQITGQSIEEAPLGSADRALDHLSQAAKQSKSRMASREAEGMEQQTSLEVLSAEVKGDIESDGKDESEIFEYTPYVKPTETTRSVGVESQETTRQ